jgi:hypothetical protein
MVSNGQIKQITQTDGDLNTVVIKEGRPFGEASVELDVGIIQPEKSHRLLQSLL